MFYNDINHITSLVPTTKNYYITLDGPSKESEKYSKIKNPKNPNFNWWFWYNVSNKDELIKLIQDYSLYLLNYYF